MRASIASKYNNSPFRLQATVTSRGVFFDRIDGKDKLLVLHTTPRRARLMAQWILDNVSAQD